MLYVIFALIVVYAALCWFYADKVFFLFPLIIPFYFLYFNFFETLKVSLVEIAVIIFLLIFFLHHHQFFNSKIIKIAKESATKYFWAATFLLVGAFLSALFSDNFLSSLHALFAWFVEPILIFAAGAKILSSTRNQKIFLWSLALSFFMIVVVSYAYLFLNIKDNGRLSGFYNSPNFLAMTLEPIFLMAVSLLFLKKKCVWQNILTLLMIVLLLVLLMFTQSFGGLFAITVSIIWTLFLVSLEEKRVYVFYISAVFIGLFLTVFFIISFNLGKIDLILSGNSHSSFNSRLPIWKTSLSIIKDNWILGTGPNSFLQEFNFKQKELNLDLDFLVVPQPHNIYMAFWVESGILGIIGFLWIIKDAFYVLWQKIKLSQNKNRWIFVGVGAFLVAILIHGLVDTPYFKYDLAYYFWTAILLISVL